MFCCAVCSLGHSFLSFPLRPGHIGLGWFGLHPHCPALLQRGIYTSEGFWEDCMSVCLGS